MTYAPPKLLEWRSHMQVWTGLTSVQLGIAGGPGHVLTGTSYHLGQDQLKMYKDPYSARHPRDVAGLTNAASACDTGWFDRLVELTAWCVAQARAGRRPDTRELIGPAADGRAYRWAVETGWRAELRPDGDDHETHLHESFFRDSEHRDKVGFYRPFFERQGDDDMDQEDKDVAWANSNRLLALLTGEAARYRVSWTPDERVEPNVPQQTAQATLDAVLELKERPAVQPAPVDPDAVKAVVREVLLEPGVLAAFAGAVLDEQHRRTAE